MVPWLVQVAGGGALVLSGIMLHAHGSITTHGTCTITAARCPRILILSRTTPRYPRQARACFGTHIIVI